MLAWMLEAGADATQPTRTPSKEAPLHIACAKRNVRALELLLDSLSRSENLQEALRQKDALGGFAPLHVCGGSWKIWSVTLPRLLAGAGELNTQALDLDEACIPLVRSLATSDGQPALATADVLAQCGFYGRGVALLIQNGAPVDARDAQNRTFLHFLHPHLIADGASSLPSIDVPYKDVISHAVSKHPDALQLLTESRLERERWHAPRPEPAPHTTFDAADQNCDDIVAVAHSDDEVLDAIRNHRPVIRRDALDASWDKAREDWGDRARLEALGGGALVRSGPIPYASAFATTERVLTLREAMARSADESETASAQRKKKRDVDAPSYVFEQIRWDGVSTDHPLFDVIKARVGDSPVSDMIIHDVRRGVGIKFHDSARWRELPRHRRDIVPTTAPARWRGSSLTGFHTQAQFFVGSRYSGAPAHYHSHAMNFLVRGKKRWLLWPPASALYSRVPAVSWLDRKDAKAYQCVQPENASLYVPAGWGHAVLNLEDHTVGVALEFHVEGELAWSFESRATDLVSSSRRL